MFVSILCIVYPNNLIHPIWDAPCVLLSHHGTRKVSWHGNNSQLFYLDIQESYIYIYEFILNLDSFSGASFAEDMKDAQHRFFKEMLQNGSTVLANQRKHFDGLSEIAVLRTLHFKAKSRQQKNHGLRLCINGWREDALGLLAWTNWTNGHRWQFDGDRTLGWKCDPNWKVGLLVTSTQRPWG